MDVKKVEAHLRSAFLLLVFLFIVQVQSKCGTRKPVVFNFGDSNSDTGGLAAALGLPIYLPNGRLFFRRSTGRFSDGRLIIDFLCENVNMRFLSPYLESLGSDFAQGANFAIGGSATQPKSVPFSLFIQVLQFLRFKTRALELTQASRFSINEDGFRNALYAIDIGQNDLSHAFYSNITYQQVLAKIPSILEEMKNAVKTIYEQGGKNFWIHNTGPLGCLPQKLSLYPNLERDKYGCIQSFNSASKAFNGGLRTLCKELRSELKNATIVYVDIYTIKYDLITSSAKYGFNNPLMTCCGYGGPPYNYNVNVSCGLPPSQVCSEGSHYISWDGVHYTEAANTITASKILSTKFSEPQLRFEYFCQA